tara:strand:- start:3309 stop:3776 length:468 start_codon:yes stop_codon:yes gene_type:complete
MASKANTHRSWGRTKTPKAMVDHVPLDYATKKRVAADSEISYVSAITGLSNTLASSTAGANGYVTENQRYLHVTVSEAQQKSVKIYIYHYATQIWAPLMIHDGNGSSYSVATATTKNSGTASEQPQTFIFDVSGADRVGFVSSDTLTVHASCTTF